MVQMKSGWMVLGGVALLSAAACGGGGNSSKATGFKDVQSLASALEAPSGTVEPATAVGVAQEFQASMQGASQNPLGGTRQKELAQSQSATIDCPNGGNYTAHVNVNGDTADMSADFNNCNMSADCKYNGSYSYFGSTVGAWSGCLSYDLDISCTNVSASVSASFSGCLGANGSFEYLVEYDSETYRVSGAYSSGSGTLTISGANGSWTCTYSSDAGSCESTTGTKFDFTADSGKKSDVPDVIEDSI